MSQKTREEDCVRDCVIYLSVSCVCGSNMLLVKYVPYLHS